MMNYITIFTDMLDDHFLDLTEEEIGKIILAALRYAKSGTEPEYEPRTVLSLTWRRIKRHLDQCADKSEKMRALGKSGGDSSGAKRSQAEGKRGQANAKRSQAKASESQAWASVGNHEQEYEYEQEQEQEYEYEQEHEQEQEHEHGVTARAREARRFRPPTVEEVSEYCRERRNGVDPQRFINHYSSNGWKVGKNPMKDWRAAVRNWEGNEYYSGGARESPANQGIQTRTEEHKTTPGYWESLEINLDDADEHGRLPGEPGYGT